MDAPDHQNRILGQHSDQNCSGGFKYWLFFQTYKGMIGWLNHHPVKSHLISSLSTMIHCITIPLYRHHIPTFLLVLSWMFPIKSRKLFWWNRKNECLTRLSWSRDLCTNNRRWRLRSCGRWVVWCSNFSVLAEGGEWFKFNGSKGGLKVHGKAASYEWRKPPTQWSKKTYTDRY